MSKILKFVGIIFFFRIIRIGCSQDCLDTGWEKIINMKPESINNKSTLFVGANSQGLVNTCFERCKKTNCKAFLIDVSKSVCLSVQSDGDDFVPEPNVTFYHKICIKVPSACKKMTLWQVDRTIGAIFIDTSTDWQPKLMTRRECYEKCFRKGEQCKSAQFRTSRDLTIGDTVGKCALSKYERGIRPQAYRASWYRDEYLQSQCHKISKDEYCSYAEYRNSSLTLSDLKIPNLSMEECEKRCDESKDGFVCRSYTIIPNSRNSQPTCFLNSEDTISAGASGLVPMAGAVYKEREPCLDLKVKCSNSSLIVELETSEPFHGRMYASGFSDSCGIQGNGNNLTILNLSIPKVNELMSSNMNCGITPAFSINNENLTHIMVWSTIIVQFNPIIQRQGDQAVRVGCSLDDGTMPEPRNISVHSSFTFLNPDAGIPPIISTVVNTSSQVPTVHMKILDEFFKEAKVTKLGQKLILKIQLEPLNGTYDIKAGHLVSSSNLGDASILLLDETGCPIDSNVFPALMKDPADNRSLIGEFNAFRFPDSHGVRFTVVVKFCLEKCEPTICKSRQISYGRKRREINRNSTDANVYEINKNSESSALDELSLQFLILVEDDNINPDFLLSGLHSKPDTCLNNNGNICMNSVVAFSLIILWLIIQIILIAGCFITITRYRKEAKQAEEDRADILARHLYGIHGGNFEISRRVRWADHNSSTVS
ncbi:uncharacterized protein LOC127281034 [Leptopilina boulardi]|uniref:uncharacterized protein LOC127281034 n=1 Tax=Leptopilina boulardi TaxID=63433 RepID=UPI0021F5DB94|nr:uncharacterized protein LOC127281034 [Leptopilina boulardi]